jgi:hypothetical protein
VVILENVIETKLTPGGTLLYFGKLFVLLNCCIFGFITLVYMHISISMYICRGVYLYVYVCSYIHICHLC